MTITNDSESWIGTTLIDDDGNKLGRIEAIYFDQETGRAQWMAVKTGLLGSRHTFVPLDGATPTEDAIMTPYDKDLIDEAPRVAPDEDLPDQAAYELYAHYGLPYDAPADSEHAVPADRAA